MQEETSKGERSHATGKDERPRGPKKRRRTAKQHEDRADTSASHTQESNHFKARLKMRSAGASGSTLRNFNHSKTKDEANRSGRNRALDGRGPDPRESTVHPPLPHQLAGVPAEGQEKTSKIQLCPKIRRPSQRRGDTKKTRGHS